MTELFIVRRYLDANGHAIGELYLREPMRLDWRMVGMTLDSMPMDYTSGYGWRLDARHDFLAPLGWRTVRVGGTGPDNHRNVQRLVHRRVWPWTRLHVENRFIEAVPA